MIKIRRSDGACFVLTLPRREGGDIRGVRPIPALWAARAPTSDHGEGPEPGAQPAAAPAVGRGPATVEGGPRG